MVSRLPTSGPAGGGFNIHTIYTSLLGRHLMLPEGHRQQYALSYLVGEYCGQLLTDRFTYRRFSNFDLLRPLNYLGFQMPGEALPEGYEQQERERHEHYVMADALEAYEKRLYEMLRERREYLDLLEK